MKPVCIGLALVIMAAGCQQRTEKAGKQSRDTPQSGNSLTSGAADVSSGEGSSGWVSDSWNSVVEKGNQSAADTTEWLNALYKSSVDQGLTSAKSMKDWVASDWQSQGDWEYKLLTVNSNEISETETRLNELGSGRWECFHMTEQNGNWVFFMKRSRKSVLSHVPFRDLVKVLPLIGGREEGQ